jgi:hypothetical protein
MILAALALALALAAPAAAQSARDIEELVLHGPDDANITLRKWLEPLVHDRPALERLLAEAHFAPFRGSDGCDYFSYHGPAGANRLRRWAAVPLCGEKLGFVMVGFRAVDPVPAPAGCDSPGAFCIAPPPRKD